MAEASLDIQSGFIPYSDGSGFQVAVTLRDRNDGQGPTLSIETSYEFDASKWPEVRDGIDRLLRVLPLPNGDR
jgi:hypothetical protein